MKNIEEYGVEIKRPAGMEGGDYFWKVISVEHVPPGENGGNRHVYVDVYGLHGEELRGSPVVKVFWGWDGQKSFEESPSVSLDKPSGEHMANIPMNWGQEIFVSITSPENYCREIVSGLHTAHPDEGDDVRTGHHSFVVKFQLTKFVESEEPGKGDLKERLALVIRELNEIYASII